MGSQPTVEDMGLTLFGNIYHGRRVLVTGHTGFKGSWLAMWLSQMGAEVIGISLSPETSPNHFDLLKLDIEDIRLDIRDRDNLTRAITKKRPEMVFHLAAQPLVRRSYHNPVETWATNVMGTAHLLDACRKIESLRSIVVITTDKCYQNHGWPWGYREIDTLGGHDPYSASKAAVELLVASYRESFMSGPDAPLLATARSGNVIGGGDWAEDRLIPDLIRSLFNNKVLEIRSPYSTRPWQHVLESLSGYLFLNQKLFLGERRFAEAWNFGPSPDGKKTVQDILSFLKNFWPQIQWHVTSNTQPHEAHLLYLDSSKAHSELSWTPVWDWEDALTYTAEWYLSYLSGKVESGLQLQRYLQDAEAIGASWCLQ